MGWGEKKIGCCQHRLESNGAREVGEDDDDHDDNNDIPINRIF